MPPLHSDTNRATWYRCRRWAIAADISPMRGVATAIPRRCTNVGIGRRQDRPTVRNDVITHCAKLHPLSTQQASQNVASLATSARLGQVRSRQPLASRTAKHREASARRRAATNVLRGALHLHCDGQPPAIGPTTDRSVSIPPTPSPRWVAPCQATTATHLHPTTNFAADSASATATACAAPQASASAWRAFSGRANRLFSWSYSISSTPES